MKITLEMIEAKNPCEEGLAWFNQNYPGGEVDYQELLNAISEDNERHYGTWLLDNIGPDMRVETKLHSANGRLEKPLPRPSLVELRRSDSFFSLP